MATAETKSIHELFTGGYKFLIKPYQRGYRWENKQIECLIKDLSSFDPREEEYCLQPIIVKRIGDGNEYELVDGQQRLTTLWILKEFYASMHSTFVDDSSKDNYKLIYENKHPLQSILLQLHDKLAEDKELVEKLATDQLNLYSFFASELKTDEYGSTKSYKENEHPDIDSVLSSVCCIAKYADVLPNLGKQHINYFLENIFKPQDNSRRSKAIKIIWHELEKEDDPITVFTNVNANKIKLTNAELIKARLMYEISKKGEQDAHALTRENLALQWENIERLLNDDGFWYFVHGKTGRVTTRIDYLFEIYLQVREIEEKEKKEKEKKDEYWIYDEIDAQIEKGTTVKRIWDKISNIFYTLQDWFRDETNELFHLLGLSIALKNEDAWKTISAYYKAYSLEARTKRALCKKLKADIRRTVLKDFNKSFTQENLKSWLDEMDYDDTKERIKNVLLTYNIASLINSKNTYERFPFDLYHLDNYDIEHINPKSNYNDEPDEEIKEKNTKRIGNLVLLDANTNRSDAYKTEPYSRKREIIIKILRRGDTDETRDKPKYIPIGTRWVFLEAFENLKKDDQVADQWTKHDEYIEDIAKNLYDLFEGTGSDISEDDEENEE